MRLNLASILIGDPPSVRRARNGNKAPVGWLLFSLFCFALWAYFAAQFAEAFAGTAKALFQGFSNIFLNPG